MLYLQDLATVDSILLRELPAVDDAEAVRKHLLVLLHFPSNYIGFVNSCDDWIFVSSL